MTNEYIYIMENPMFQKNLLKIGKTKRSPQVRAKELYTTGVPKEFTISYEECVPDCNLAEKAIHNKLSQYRYNNKREFFKLPLKEAIFKIQEFTQRQYYQTINNSHIHFFEGDMTMRWFCYDYDFIFIARYKSPIFSKEPNFIDCWNCSYGDQFLITSHFKNDPSEITSADTAIKGFLIDSIDIYPGDRIAWIGTTRNEIEKNSSFCILSISIVNNYAKMLRHPREVTIVDGFPLSTGELFWSSGTKHPAMKTIKEAASEINTMGLPDIWGEPDIN